MSMTCYQSDRTVIKRGEHEAIVTEEPDGRWRVTVRCWDTRDEAERQADRLLGEVAGRHNAVREGARFGEGNPGPPPSEVQR